MGPQCLLCNDFLWQWDSWSQKNMCTIWNDM